MKFILDILAGLGLAITISIAIAYFTGNLKYNITIMGTVYKNTELNITKGVQDYA